VTEFSGHYEELGTRRDLDRARVVSQEAVKMTGNHLLMLICLPPIFLVLVFVLVHENKKR